MPMNRETRSKLTKKLVNSWIKNHVICTPPVGESSIALILVPTVSVAIFKGPVLRFADCTAPQTRQFYADINAGTIALVTLRRAFSSRMNLPISAAICTNGVTGHNGNPAQQQCRNALAEIGNSALYLLKWRRDRWENGLTYVRRYFLALKRRENVPNQVPEICSMS